MKFKYLGGLFVSSYLLTLIPKQCNVPVVKSVDRIIADSCVNAKTKNIVVLDNFKKTNVHIDYDLIPDVPHGVVVSKIIENGLPNSNIKKINVPLAKKFYESDNRKNIINPLLKDIKNGKKYDAINISMGIHMSFEKFVEQTGINVTAENLSSKAREIKDYLLKHPNKSLYNGRPDSVKIAPTIDFIDGLDSISSKGTKIFISAGNEGADSFNFLSLVDNSINVGALNSLNKKSLYSADNSLVNRWASGIVEIKKVKNGFSLTEDKKPDIESKNTTGLFKIPSGILTGTSFSAPNALVKDLKD